MNAPSVDIKEMLIADGNVDTTNYPIHIGVEPADNFNCIIIFDVPGGPPQLNFNKTEIYEFPSLQIKVRTTDYREGWAISDSIKNSLHGRAQEPLNGTLYSLIQCMNGPGFLGRDENQRMHFVVNFNIQKS